ncbi:MAG: hypothetical protein M3R38_22180 [Actinomycetota bacterium]|nr:hypothetical protein [Actinomycetota bacterium]
MSEQQGNQGNVENTEGQGQQQTQQQQQQQQPVTDVLSPEAKRILKKEREEAREAERKRVQEEYGDIPPEEAKRLREEAREREDADKDAQTRLQERDQALKEAKTEGKGHKERADRYEAIVKASVEAQTEALPEDIRDLLSSFDVAGQFEWLAKHGEKYRAMDEEPTQQQRRAPDASRSRTQEGTAMGASDLDSAKRRFNEGLFSRIRT